MNLDWFAFRWNRQRLPMKFGASNNTGQCLILSLVFIGRQFINRIKPIVKTILNEIRRKITINNNMKNYRLNFNPHDGNLNRLISNSINFLAGASLAMEATGGSRLKVTFAEKSVILFQTDSENFVSYLRDRFNQYNATISEFNFDEKQLSAIACQLKY